MSIIEYDGQDDFLWPQQNLPIKNEYPATWDLVLNDLDAFKFPHPKQNELLNLVKEDIKLRDHTGEMKYGVRLQPFNGRNSLQDAYEEFLDGMVYVRNELFQVEQIRIETEYSKMKKLSLGSIFIALVEMTLRIKHLIELDRNDITPKIIL